MTHPQKSSVDPGQQYGVIGIIMLVIGLPFIGIFLSVIGYKKSKKAGYDNTLAQVGIWLNAIFTIVVAFLIIAFTTVIVGGYKEGKRHLQQVEDAERVVRGIQDYAATFTPGVRGYPDFQTLLDAYTTSGHMPLPGGIRLIESNNPRLGEVGYEKCVLADGTISGFKLHYADENGASSKTDDPFEFYHNASKTIGNCN